MTSYEPPPQPPTTHHVCACAKMSPRVGHSGVGREVPSPECRKNRVLPTQETQAARARLATEKRVIPTRLPRQHFSGTAKGKRTCESE
jgi:hypothetical protein